MSNKALNVTLKGGVSVTHHELCASVYFFALSAAR